MVESAETEAAEALADLPAPEPLTNLLLDRVRRSGDRVITYSKVGDRWVGHTWKEAMVRIEETALGLLELGVKAGDKVAIISNTRQEWGMCDLAILCMGGITVGLYPTLTAEQIRYLLEHSESKVIFVENDGLREKVEVALAGATKQVPIVQFEGRPPRPAQLELEALRRKGAARRIEHPEELERRMRQNQSRDVVTYVYTSGTTGEPKGAALTHANFHYVIHATQKLVPYEGHRTLAFLPLAHSLQRYVSYLALITDVEAYFAESMDAVRANIQEVQPTAFAVIPRVLEKIHGRIMASGAQKTGAQAQIFRLSLDALSEVGTSRRAGHVPRLRARIAAEVADRLVGQRVRRGLGGRVEFLGCGSAPLARDVHEFFENIGIPILEGWGLTETSAPATINTLESRRIGTVGRPLPGTNVKIAPDGEILVKGPGVFTGYYQNPEATREAFDDEGWFKTGDIGAISRSGFLTITDRKKDLIITSGGKNIAPQPIEHLLKREPLIGQAVLIGDRRPYLVALLGIDAETRLEVARAHGLPEDTEIETLVAHPIVRARIEKHVEEVNAKLPRYEQIKKWDVLPDDMSIDSGELTPTMKVKRRVVSERHQARIEQLYNRPE